MAPSWFPRGIAVQPGVIIQQNPALPSNASDSPATVSPLQPQPAVTRPAAQPGAPRGPARTAREETKRLNNGWGNQTLGLSLMSEAGSLWFRHARNGFAAEVGFRQGDETRRRWHPSDDPEQFYGQVGTSAQNNGIAEVEHSARWTNASPAPRLARAEDGPSVRGSEERRWEPASPGPASWGKTQRNKARFGGGDARAPRGATKWSL